MGSYLEENEIVLPDTLVITAREDVQSTPDAMQECDKAGATVTGQALVETLEAVLHVGEEISGGN